MDDANGLDGQHDGGDEHSAVMKLLASENWQKRLEEARQSREKILAQKTAIRKTPSIPLQFDGVPKRVIPVERIIRAAPPPEGAPAEPRPDTPPDSRTAPPAVVVHIARPVRPVPDTRAEPVAQPRPPTPASLPAARASAASLPALAPVAPPPELPVPAAVPTRGVGLRSLTGFGIGVIAGVGITTLLWLGRPEASGEAVPVTGAAAPVVATTPTAAPAETAAAPGPAEAPPPAASPNVASRLAIAADPAAGLPDATLAVLPLETGAVGVASQPPAAPASPAPESPPTGLTVLSSPDAQNAVQTLASLEAEPMTTALPGPLLRPAGAGTPRTGSSVDGPTDAAVAAPEPAVAPLAFAGIAEPSEPSVEFAALLPAPAAVPAAMLPVALRGPAAPEAAPAAMTPPPPPVLAPAVSQRPPDTGTPGAVAQDSQVAVKVLAPKALREAEVATLASGLREAGYQVGEPTPVGVKVSATHVRYYHPGDRASAETLALRFKGEARDFTGSADRAPPGTIELWLQGSAPKATKAKPVKAKASGTAKAKAKAKKPPPEDPQVRVLRERLLGKLKTVNKS